MKTIDFIETAGDDGVLRLQVPVEEAGKRYHVVVHLEPESAVGEKPKQGWPPRFFEETAGKWVGEFLRAPQGDYEQREKL